jgi:hypothetical protein
MTRLFVRLLSLRDVPTKYQRLTSHCFLLMKWIDNVASNSIGKDQSPITGAEVDTPERMIGTLLHQGCHGDLTLVVPSYPRRPYPELVKQTIPAASC